MAQVRLYRDPANAKIGGVCAGVAEAFGWDVTLLRLAWAFTALLAGAGIIVYLVCWFVMPTKAEALGTSPAPTPTPPPPPTP